MRILVTGSLGTIGRVLALELRERGHEVHGCDLAHDTNETGPHFPTGGNYSRCDVGEFRQIEALLNWLRPELVYHTAAEFGRWNGEDFYELLWRTNVIGTKNVIRLQERFRFKLVHFSSSEVYGETNGRVMHEDVACTDFLNDYAMTKYVNEQQIRNSQAMYGTQNVIVRLFNTYGPGEHYSPYRSVNCRFLYAAMVGAPLTVYEGGRRTSTFVFDTVNTLANIADTFFARTIYNIGGNTDHSILELAQLAIKCFDSKSKIIEEPCEPMTTSTKVPDITRAVKELKHKCTVSLEEGMERTAAWMRTVYGK